MGVANAKKVGPWCTELLTTSKCTTAKCKVQVATSLAAVEVQNAENECARAKLEVCRAELEVCRAELEVCRAELEVSGEYQKGWFT